MESVITQAYYFYILAIASGTILGVVATILYAGLYSLRS